MLFIVSGARGSYLNKLFPVVFLQFAWSCIYSRCLFAVIAQFIYLYRSACTLLEWCNNQGLCGVTQLSSHIIFCVMSFTSITRSKVLNRLSVAVFTRWGLCILLLRSTIPMGWSYDLYIRQTITGQEFCILTFRCAIPARGFYIWELRHEIPEWESLIRELRRRIPVPG